MAASTFTKKAHLASRGMVRSLCATTTDLVKSGITNCLASSMLPAGTAVGGSGLPGAMRSTIAADVFRVPIRYDDSKVIFYIYTDSICASSSSFLTLAMRKPYHGSTIQDASPAWGSGVTVGTSAEEAGWKLFHTTREIIATSSEGEAFIAGPFETMRYALNFGPTSTGGGSTKGGVGYDSKHYIEKYQNYLEFSIGLTTAVNSPTTGTWTEAVAFAYSTNGSICVVPIEIP